MSESFNRLVDIVHDNKDQADWLEVSGWVNFENYNSLGCVEKNKLDLYVVLKQRALACDVFQLNNISGFEISSDLNIRAPSIGFFHSLEWFRQRAKVDLSSFPEHYSVRNLSDLEVIKLFESLPTYEINRRKPMEDAVNSMVNCAIELDLLCADDRFIYLDSSAPIEKTMNLVEARLRQLKSEDGRGKGDIPFFTKQGIAIKNLPRVVLLIDLYLHAFVKNKGFSNDELHQAFSSIIKATLDKKTLLKLKQYSEKVLEQEFIENFLSEYMADKSLYLSREKNL